MKSLPCQSNLRPLTKSAVPYRIHSVKAFTEGLHIQNKTLNGDDISIVLWSGALRCRRIGYDTVPNVQKSSIKDVAQYVYPRPLLTFYLSLSRA